MTPALLVAMTLFVNPWGTPLAKSAILHVPLDHATIQAAIEAAEDGDHVLVQDGRYEERIDFLGKAITVRAARDLAATIALPNRLRSGVLFVSGEGPSSVLRGFRIEGWIGHGPGPALGGLLLCDNGASPIVEDCALSGGRASNGGAVALVQSEAEFRRCTFSNSWAHGERGGGVFIEGGKPRFTNCEVRGNKAGSEDFPGEGGGLWIGGAASVELQDCWIDDNGADSATFVIGAGICVRDSEVFARGCDIRSNAGTGIYAETAKVEVYGSRISANESCAVYCRGSGNVVLLEGCDIDANRTPSINCGSSDVTLMACRIRGNSSEGAVGTIEVGSGGRAHLEACLLANNQSGDEGGTARVFGELTAVNCEIVGNRAAAIVADGGSVRLTCCTVRDNRGGGEAAIWGRNAADIEVEGSILWENEPVELGGDIGVVRYSCVQGGWPGEGNIAGDPRFKFDNASSTLRPGSPAIDAASFPGAPENDILGNPRPWGRAADMGAYEYTDVACDLRLDLPALERIRPGERAHFQLEIINRCESARAFDQLDVHLLPPADRGFSLYAGAQITLEPDSRRTYELDVPTPVDAPEGTLPVDILMREEGVLVDSLRIYQLVGGVLRVPSAYPTIQEAIEVSEDGDLIIVAEGHYAETLDFLGRAITVRSTDPTDEGVVSRTVLSRGDDRALVRMVSGEGYSSVLAGFTLELAVGSALDCRGLALQTVGSGPTIRHCVFRNNVNDECVKPKGGAVFSERSWTRFENCRFEGNRLEAHSVWVDTDARGGALFAMDSDISFVGCEFHSNSVTANAQWDSHEAIAHGGGIYAEQSTLALQDCIFTTNHVHGYGESTGPAYGGALCLLNGTLTIDGSEFHDNSAETAGDFKMDARGGAIHLDGSGLVEASRFGGNSCYTDGWSGLWNHELTGGALDHRGDTLVVRATTFEGNRIDLQVESWMDGISGAGAAIYLGGANARLEGALVRGNTTEDWGRNWTTGAGLEIDGDALLRNTLIIENSGADYGAGLRIRDALVKVEFCTIAANQADTSCGAISFGRVGKALLENSIVWANEPAMCTVDSLFARYSDIGGGHPGEGNIDADPRFGSYRNRDYVLSDRSELDLPGSPCIDAADPALVDGLPWPDWYVNTELADMGAYGGPGGTVWLPDQAIRITSAVCE